MPTQSRGFFSCDFCGLQHDTEEEAREHELTQCPRRRPLPGTAAAFHQQQQYQRTAAGRPYHLEPQQSIPPYASAMGPLSVAETEGYAHHTLATSAPAGAGAPFLQPSHPGIMGGSSDRSKDKGILLLNPHERNPNLTPPDVLACQHIEVFEATPEIISEYDENKRQAQQESKKSTASSSPPPSPKQVGMRCVHCVKHPQSAPPTTMTSKFRTVFPPSVASMADLVRQMAHHHLSSCRLTPVDVQEACQQASSERRQKQEQKQQPGAVNVAKQDDDDRVALIDFCVGFCQQVGIANKQQHKSGLEFVEGVPSMRGTPATRFAQDHQPPSSMYLDRTVGGHSYSKQPPSGMARMGMGPVGDPPGHIAPTPLQRTRGDRPVDEPLPSSAAITTPSTMGYPTPWSIQRGDVPTPAQPVFERRDSSGGGSTYPPSAGGTRVPSSDASPRREYEDSQQQKHQYELPSIFPFFQERDGTWHCKYCANIHPQFREPQSIWGSRDGSPPPANFIDHHLSMCRGYQQGFPPVVMMHPSSFGMPPFGPGGWDGSHMPFPPPNDYPYGYPPPHVPSHLEANARTGGRFGLTEQESGGMYPAPRGRPTIVESGVSMVSSVNAENMAQAMNYLAQFDKDYYERDAETAAIPRLVLGEDRLLLTDYFYFLMKQLRLCRFSEADRKTRGGKREKIKLGYGGLQCIHCADLPMSRKFFWSNVDRLANSFAEIPGHVLKCKHCPPQSKDSLLLLKQAHPEQMAKLPRGSQKVFFRRMWARLHDGDPIEGDDQAVSPKRSVDGTIKTEPAPQPTVNTKTSPESHKSSDISPSSGQSDETALVVQRTAKEAAEALAASAKESNPAGPPSPSSRVLLAIPEDKEWLSEKDIFVRKQLEVFCATEEDVAAARADLKYPVSVGQVGIRCIHCALSQGSDAAGHAVAYPYTISGIHESVREIHRLHLDSCKNLPAFKKAKLDNLGASSLSSVLRRYYVLGAKALGLRDTTNSGIRSGGVSSPIGSQAAFTFAEADDEEVISEGKDQKPIGREALEESKVAVEERSGTKRSPNIKDESEPPSKMAKKESD